VIHSVTDFVDVAGSRLEYRRIEPRRSDGPTLVFLHDGLGSMGTWRDIPEDLAQMTGCGAVIYSRAGYGASSRKPGPWPVRFMHDEALITLPALLSALKIDDCIFVGHSDGASIALIAAVAAPWTHSLSLRGLALEAPHTFVEPVCLESIARMRETYRTSGLAESLARYHGEQADECFDNWSGIWLDPAFRDWNIQEGLSQLKLPVLVVQGDADEFGTVEQLKAITSRVRGVTSELLLSGVGHTPHRDRRPEVVAAWGGFVLGLCDPPRRK
jgi:pimeloyl-ACP methyl ester carboxylesterase